MSDTAFHFSDGSKAQTLSELMSILQKVDSSVTARHITADRNDYALWITHVHNDHALAEEVRKCHTPHEVASVIDKKLHPQTAAAQLTPLKEKLRAIAPKPTLATAKPKPQEAPAHISSPEHEHAFTPAKPQHTPPPSQEAPRWTPSTPLPSRSGVALKNNPHVRDFVLGLVIGIVIGVLAYGLLLQVV